MAEPDWSDGSFFLIVGKSMNADVSLALMAKATAVFAQLDQFLTFPMTPIAWQAVRLGFQRGDLPPADTMNAMAEFARLANTIPDGVIFPPAEDTVLWDVFHDVFKTAVLAGSTRTPQDEASYQAAIAKLYTRWASSWLVRTEMTADNDNGVTFAI